MAELTKEYLDSILVYDKTSPTYIRWKNDSEYFKAGDVAGYTTSPVNFPFIYLNGAKYAISLIVWVMHGKKVPDSNKALMPINGIYEDVSIENLHEVTLYQRPL